jgi:hypothetical protein
VFPRGAQLSGHLQDYKDPGHFFGKGSLSLEFDRLILPNAEVLPLTTKIISAPHQRVDKKDRSRAKGIPGAMPFCGWFPVFWPIKVLTLPARGPFPTLKGESRLAMRLMEDVELPLPVTARKLLSGAPLGEPEQQLSVAIGDSARIGRDAPADSAVGIRIDSVNSFGAA